MKLVRSRLWGGVLLVLVAALARAGDSPTVVDDGPSEATPNADAPRKATISLSEIRARAETMPIDRRNDIDKRIAVTIERVNKEAVEKGLSTVAARLAVEFDMTPEALLDEKGVNGLSFGELVIAHTLIANSDAAVTLHDLVTLRTEGRSWGAIAFGLRFHMEDFEDAIKAEGRVAMGLSKADGKVAPGGK